MISKWGGTIHNRFFNSNIVANQLSCILCPLLPGWMLCLSVVNGTSFDSTEGRFAPFEINDNIIPGFKEALTTFPRGSKAYIIIPQEIAYADQGSQGIQPGSTIIFEIEIAE